MLEAGNNVNIVPIDAPFSHPRFIASSALNLKVKTQGLI